MKKFRKIILALTVVALITTMACSFAACNNSEPQDEEIVIWAWNKNVNALNAAIETYKKDVDPNFKARVESFARKDIDKKFKTASQTGDKSVMADIILCDAMNILTYNDLWSDFFVDLGPSVSAEERAKYVPSTMKSVEIGDKLIGLPIGIGPTVVFANTELWDAETLARVQTEGWTWDEYATIGQSIKAAKGNDVYMTAYNMRTDDRIYRTMVSQKGEWFMDMNYDIKVGNANSVAAMTKVKAMQDAGVVGHIDTGDYKSLMKNGKIAAQIQGFFLGGQLKDVAPEMAGKWAVLPLPKWTPDDTAASITGGSYLYANSAMTGTKKDKAIAFMKWVTLDGNAAVQRLQVGGIYPSVTTAYETDYFKTTKDAYFTNTALYKDVADWSLDAKPIFATKYNGFNYDTFIAAQEKILFTTDYTSIEDVLTGVANTIRGNAK